jgi:hypothetical protein
MRGMRAVAANRSGLRVLFPVSIALVLTQAAVACGFGTPDPPSGLDLSGWPCEGVPMRDCQDQRCPHGEICQPVQTSGFNLCPPLTCQPGCRSDNGCPAGYKCDVQESSCVCKDDSVCGAGLACIEGNCFDTCRSNRDCAVSWVCARPEGAAGLVYPCLPASSPAQGSCVCALPGSYVKRCLDAGVGEQWSVPDGSLNPCAL